MTLILYLLLDVPTGKLLLGSIPILFIHLSGNLNSNERIQNASSNTTPVKLISNFKLLIVLILDILQGFNSTKNLR